MVVSPERLRRCHAAMNASTFLAIIFLLLGVLIALISAIGGDSMYGSAISLYADGISALYFGLPLVLAAVILSIIVKRNSQSLAIQQRTLAVHLQMPWMLLCLCVIVLLGTIAIDIYVHRIINQRDSSGYNAIESTTLFLYYGIRVVVLLIFGTRLVRTTRDSAMLLPNASEE